MYFYLQREASSYIKGYQADHFFTMRVKPGDTLETTDLQGTLTKIRVSEVDKKNRTIFYDTVEEKKYLAYTSENVLFQAITDKAYLEKMIEITPHAHVDIVYLFVSDRSPVGGVIQDRLEKILIRSCEQAEKLFKPTIKIVDKSELSSLISKYLPTVLQADSISQNILSSGLGSSKSVIVGPEGGWSQGEISTFKENDLRFESLGSEVYPAWLAGYTWFVKHRE